MTQGRFAVKESNSNLMALRQTSVNFLANKHVYHAVTFKVFKNSVSCFTRLRWFLSLTKSAFLFWNLANCASAKRERLKIDKNLEQRQNLRPFWFQFPDIPFIYNSNTTYILLLNIFDHVTL